MQLEKLKKRQKELIQESVELSNKTWSNKARLAAQQKITKELRSVGKKIEAIQKKSHTP